MSNCEMLYSAKKVDHIAGDFYRINMFYISKYQGKLAQFDFQNVTISHFERSIISPSIDIKSGCLSV